MFTDEQGRALFGTFEATRHRVRVEMLGMATETTELFDAHPGVIVRQELRLHSRPILLEGLDVAASERCRIRPQEGLAAQVWEEARKALVAAEFTDRERAYRYETMLYERDIDRDTRVITREEQSRRRGRMRTAWRSRRPEELVENGFAQSSGNETLYFAPDAGVLLSDIFLDSHCMRIERAGDNEETVGLIGLAFEPRGRRGGGIDITGTLWLDPSTAELRWFEYRYAHLDPDISSDYIGGRVDFRRMPRGTWIVPEWWIRVPVIAWGRGLDGSMQQVLVGFRQSGGRVINVEDDMGRSMSLGRSATIVGVVRDSLASSPLPGVRVEIMGGTQQVFTNAEGRFRIIGLMTGIYRVRFVDPRLEPWKLTPEPITVEVHGGEVTQVILRMPSMTELLLAARRAAVPTLRR